MSQRKRVIPLVWCISTVDGEQVEWGIGWAVNSPNQSKLSENRRDTCGQIFDNNSTDLSTYGGKVQFENEIL